MCNSLALPDRGDSNEYTQHTIIKYIKKTPLNYIHLHYLSGSNYSYIEQIYIAPKMFGLLRFDYTSKPISEDWRLAINVSVSC